MSMTTELAQRMKVAAEREMVFRDTNETSNTWQYNVTPENVLALVEALEARDKQIHEYHSALNSLAFVARRYLPDYDEHPEIQAADKLLESATGVAVDSE